MKAIIVEDKPYIRKGLVNLLSMIDSDVTIVGECESVQEALIVTKTCQPELIFLDINLGDGTAFDFLDQVPSQNFKIIFITAYEEYALKALKIGAVDYLLKPVDLEELAIALQKVSQLSIADQQQRIKKTKLVWDDAPSTLILSLQDSYQVIDINTLMYCESDKGYTTFYEANGKKHMVSKTLKSFEERLQLFGFVRTHQSFMVHLKYIDKYDKSGWIYLKNGQKIPVSSRKRDLFLGAFLKTNGAQ